MLYKFCKATPAVGLVCTTLKTKGWLHIYYLAENVRCLKHNFKQRIKKDIKCHFTASISNFRISRQAKTGHACFFFFTRKGG